MSTTHTTGNGVGIAQGAQSIPASPAATAWAIDPRASRAEFTIGKRLLFRRLTVTGRFSDIAGTIVLDEGEPANSTASVTIGAASIDTQNARRDKHLRTADFFHVDQHPTLTFVSRRIETLDRAAGRYRVTGDLSVRGVTRQVVLDAVYTPAQGGAREPRLKLTLTASLNRRDFGMTWGNLMIQPDDNLTVSLAVEATRA